MIYLTWKLINHTKETLKIIWSITRLKHQRPWLEKWKNVTEGDNTTVQISDHGIISDKYYDNKAYAFYSLADQEKYDGDTTSKEEIEHTFEVIQEAVKSEGYQVKSAKEVYIQANSNYCFVPVNGGKNIPVLRGGNEFAAKLEKVK